MENSTSESTDYLDQLDVSGTITGGNTRGGLLDTVDDRELRQIGFREVQAPQEEGGQTWVVVHGWNSSPDAENVDDLIASTVEAADDGDRILALDWREAAANRGAYPGRIISPLAGGGNGIAATWIRDTAELSHRILVDEYGIDPANASQELNFVGHSLGSLVSSEIGQIYKQENGQGVRTITALDPASEGNLKPSILFGEDSGYDVDGSLNGRQAPADFNDSAVFSRSFIGAKSVGGNPIFADAADEAYELDFGNTFDFGGEHQRVVQFYSNLSNDSSKIGDLLNYDSYQSIETSPTREFGDTNVTRRLFERTYQGIIKVDSSNRPTRLTANSAVDDNGKIIIGEYLPDVIDGGTGNDRLFGEGDSDTITGQSADDLLVGGSGNDRLSGDGSANIGDDILYGGTGIDILTGDGGVDIFAFQAGDGSSDRAQANIITDFEVGVDGIGLIEIDSDTLTFEGDAVDSTIKLGSEYLAVLEGVSLDEITSASQSATFYSSVELTDVDIV